MSRWGIVVGVVFVIMARGPLAAEVKEAVPDHLVVAQTADLAADSTAAYRALARIAEWWNAEHTWSGDAGNLSLELAAGGCFCERWPEGSVQHGRVILAHSGRTLRLDAPLGPIQELGARGTLTFRFTPQGTGTRLEVSYIAVGFASNRFDTLAPVVDGVIGEQVGRFARFVNGGSAKSR